MQIDDRAARDIRKLDRDEQHRILSFLRGRVATDGDPRRFGQPLTGSKTGLWRYRVGAYRLICRIEDACVVVLLLAVGHRRECIDNNHAPLRAPDRDPVEISRLKVPREQRV